MTKPTLILMLAVTLFCCSCIKETPPVTVDAASLKYFKALPAVMESPDNPLSPEKIDLGRMLYYEKRLSLAGDVACNTCHLLDKFGVDGEPTSTGHKGQKGNRNAPTVYNAAGHFVQFWDGRAKDVEAQAKGPILNPVEMAMPSEKKVVATLKAIPVYVKAFKAAFPRDKEPINYDNMAKAIGAFERRLVTPARWDKFLSGDQAAMTEVEKQGFNKFMETGCQTCHAGAFVGGAMFQKLGAVTPWPSTSDLGRQAVTKQDADRMMFKVPSLRNIDKTGPYYHDGSVATLEDAVKKMADFQLGKKLADPDVQAIVAWLKTLTGEVPADYIKPPELPKPGA